MPPLAQRHTHSTLAPWLENLLPDRPDVLARWRREFRVTDSTPFALLRHVGEDVAGAAQFVRPERVEHATEPGPVEPASDADIAARLSQLRTDPTSWEPATGTGGRFSLAGAQSKFALHFDGTQWGLPTGRTPTTHILKPAIRDLADQDINEHLSMRAARAVGILVPATRIATFDGERAFVVQRYDRTRLDSQWVRVHQEDMCQALGRPPEGKYEANGGPSAVDIARVIRESMPAGRAQADLRRFADAIIYNWLIVGTDAHAKNYSLLLARGQVRLAPLYDVNSWLPYKAPRHRPTLSMKIGNHKTRPDLINAEDWKAFAKSVGVPEDYVFTRIAEMARTVPAAFNDVSKDAEIRALGSDMPPRLADLVAANVARCAQAVGRGG